VGTVYSVEYVTDLAQTNDWRCLTFLQPPATNYLWFDPTAPATGKRFYRAVQFDAPTNLVFIPPGTFNILSKQMGNSAGLNVNNVTIRGAGIAWAVPWRGAGITALGATAPA